MEKVQRQKKSKRILTALGALVLALGVGVAVAPKDMMKVDATVGNVKATFESSAVVTDKGYSKYENIDWLLTFGGNDVSGGTNSKKRSDANLSSYSKYAVSPVKTTDTAFAVASKKAIANVGKISFQMDGGSNQTRALIYLLSSSDNITFSQIALTGTNKQGHSAPDNSLVEFNFDTIIESTYYAVVFKDSGDSGNFRLDNIELKFIEGATSTATLQSIAIKDGTAPAKTSYYDGDQFDPTGLTIEAFYDDGSKVDVTSSATYNPDPLTIGTTTVEITYKGKTTSYSPITVKKLAFVEHSYIAKGFTPALTTGKGGSTHEITVQHGVNFRTKSVRENSGNFFMESSSLLYTTSTMGIIKEITINAGAGTPGADVTGKVYFSATPFTDTLSGEVGTYTNKNTTKFTAPAGSQYFAIGSISGGNLAFGAIEVYYDLIDYADLTLFKIHGGNSSIVAEETLALSIDVNEDANAAATWSSSNTNVATISSFGVVSALAPGKTTIMATSSVDSSFTDSIELTVLPIVETGLTLSESSLQLKVSKTKQLIATVYPNNASDKTIEWSSSDPSKASVSSTGLVTGLEVTEEPITITATSVNGLTATTLVTVLENIIQEGTYTISTDSKDYKDPLDVSLLNIIKTDAELGDVTISNINNVRLNSLPNTNKTITIGRNGEEGGSFTIELGEGLVATAITFNGLIVDSGKTPILKINDGVNFQYSGNNSETLHPYANKLNISTLGTSRIWTTSIEIEAKRVENAATHYSNLFLAETSTECLASNVLVSTWNKLGVMYKGMDSEVKDQFNNVDSNAEGSSVEQFVARYTYIGQKYGYEDFVAIGLIQNSTNGKHNIISDRNLLTAAIIIGTAGLTTIAGYYILRNKKEIE